MSASKHNCSLVSVTDVTLMSLQRSGRVIYGQLSYVLRGVFQTSQGFGTCSKTSLCPPTREGAVGRTWALVRQAPPCTITD